MFWLPLMAVLREGIETVIFLAGTSSNYDVSHRRGHRQLPAVITLRTFFSLYWNLAAIYR